MRTRGGPRAAARRSRRRRRTRRIAIVVAVLALLGLGVPLGIGELGAGSSGSPAPHTRFITGRPASTAVTSTTVAGPSAPYPVAVTPMTFVDPTRSTAGRGAASGHAGRILTTALIYPAPPAVGPFPLVVFAHGFGQSVATYADLLRSVAAGGYVVAAPEFPLTSSAIPGPVVRIDVLNQPSDMSFLIGAVQRASVEPGPINGRVTSGKVAVMGHSDGAVTAAAVAYNSCCTDSRVGAAIILSGAESDFRGTWFGARSPPLLAVHGDADTVNPLSSSERLYADSNAASFLVTVTGGTHLEPFTNDPTRSLVARVIVDYLDTELRREPAALGRLRTDANVPGALTMP
jgi:predicted esterase